MDARKWVQDYLTFTKKERIGIIVLILIIAIIWLFPLIYTPKASLALLTKDTSWIEQLNIQSEKEQLNRENETLHDDPRNYQFERNWAPSNPKVKIELFEFDPNTLSHAGWKKLGIRDKTIQTIQNYLSKGGNFYKKEDLKRIYSLSAKDFDRLSPYINIKKRTNQEPTIREHMYTKPDKAESHFIKNKPAILDINIADTSAFIDLPGIGSRLANRIIAYRESLGGFYSTDQIAEVYALPDSTFQKIKHRLIINNTKVQQLNINTALKEELKMHPYIRWNLANAIVEYRNQHGAFNNLDDLLKIKVITETSFEKLKPYLTIQ